MPKETVMKSRPASPAAARRPFLALLALVLAVSAAWLFPGEAPATEKENVQQAMERVLRKTEEITGIRRKADIPWEILTREQVREMLRRELAREKPPERLQRETRMLRALGLIPADLDLGAFLLDLYTEQVGGFYDPKTGRYVVVEGMGALQDLVMSHELVHALQDQYAGFERRIEGIRGDEDAEMAFLSVVEGCATTAMMAYMFNKPVDDMPDLGRMAALMRLGNSMFADRMPSFAGAPAFIQESLIFPYAYGTDFLKAYLERESFARSNGLFAHPPRTTEQILHPEKYFRDRPEGPCAVEWSAAEKKAFGPGDSWADLGEFYVREFLCLGLPRPDAEAAAAGWGGDRLLVGNGSSGRTRALWKIRWDDAAAAERFAAAMARWKGKDGRRVPRLANREKDVVVLEIVGPPSLPPTPSTPPTPAGPAAPGR